MGLQLVIRLLVAFILCFQPCYAARLALLLTRSVWKVLLGSCLVCPESEVDRDLLRTLIKPNTTVYYRITSGTTQLKANKHTLYLKMLLWHDTSDATQTLNDVQCMFLRTRALFLFACQCLEVIFWGNSFMADGNHCSVVMRTATRNPVGTDH